jgi:aldose 1-epimerase
LLDGIAMDCNRANTGRDSEAQQDGRRAMIAPSGEQIEIAIGDQRAVVVEVGGGLRAYSAGGRQLVD